MPEIGLPQGRMHYHEAGEGPPVVLLHGYLMNGRLWEPVVERLRGEHRCIAPDLPLGSAPFGLDPEADLSAKGLARLVADFLAALDLDDVTLVGNDSGGAIAQIVAAEHPERLGRLVLTPCDAFDNFPPKLFRPLIAIAKAPGGLSAVFAPLKLRPARALPNAYGLLTHRDLPHDLIDEWVGNYFADKGVRRDVHKVTAQLDPNATLDAAAKLAGFDKPALIAFAPDDKIFPFEHAERLGAILPHARVERIPDSRTWVMFDQPDLTSRLIREFVAETAPAARR
jgi:pimeloyl-ACP methyl ester carboxylesterase